MTSFSKEEMAAKWYQQGAEAGFTPKQLEFLRDYFAFFSDIPKTLGDLII